MNIKITKRTLLKEINNDMVHSFYYLINGRIQNEDKTKYRRFKFIVWFDVMDIQEYFEKDSYTQTDIREYLDIVIECHTATIKSYDDCKEFYNLCNETIENWNEKARYYY